MRWQVLVRWSFYSFPKDLFRSCAVDEIDVTSSKFWVKEHGKLSNQDQIHPIRSFILAFLKCHTNIPRIPVVCAKFGVVQVSKSLRYRMTFWGTKISVDCRPCWMLWSCWNDLVSWFMQVMNLFSLALPCYHTLANPCIGYFKFSLGFKTHSTRI